MKKHAIIFASLALSCLVLSAPLSAGAVSSSQTEASSLYIITVQPELPVTERSELELTALEMTQTWQNPNPRRQLALKSVSRAGCSVYRWSSSAPVVASVDASVSCVREKSKVICARISLSSVISAASFHSV